MPAPTAEAALRFALYRRVTQHERPIVFPSIDALCRRIHIERRGKPIEGEDAALVFTPGQPPVQGVSIWALADAGPCAARDRFVGFAVTDGRDWERLRAALLRVQPPAAPELGGCSAEAA